MNLTERWLKEQGAARGAGGGGLSGELLAGAEVLLQDVVTAAPMTRAQAIDLLTADALVTHAFEVAAESPEQLPVLATEAMARIATFAEER